MLLSTALKIFWPDWYPIYRKNSKIKEKRFWKVTILSTKKRIYRHMMKKFWWWGAKVTEKNFTAIVIMHDARCNPTSEAQKNNNELQKFNNQ